MSQGAARGYALQRGEGWTYHSEIDFTVKAGERGHGRRVAVMEYTTRRGEEPPEHTHPTEDEIFYVLKGALTFQCGGDLGGPDAHHHGVTFAPETATASVPASARSSPASRTPRILCRA